MIEDYSPSTHTRVIRRNRLPMIYLFPRNHMCHHHPSLVHLPQMIQDSAIQQPTKVATISTVSTVSTHIDNRCSPLLSGLSQLDSGNLFQLFFFLPVNRRQRTH